MLAGLKNLTVRYITHSLRGRLLSYSHSKKHAPGRLFRDIRCANATTFSRQ